MKTWQKITIGIVATLILISMLGRPSNTIRTPAAAARPEALVSSPEISAEPKLTLAKYSALKTGMSYREAVAVLGAPGVEQSSNDIGGSRTVLYAWSTDGMGNMNAMFQNDKLVQKAQFGLE